MSNSIKPPGHGPKRRHRSLYTSPLEVECRREEPLTVCIAAIGQEGRAVYVVLAADRMLTTGIGDSRDTEYEPRSVAGLTLKMSQLTKTCALMIAGNVADSTAIIQASGVAVTSKGVTAVEGVANVVTDVFADLRARRAAQKYLAPLNLTPQNFISNSRSLHDLLIEALAEQVQKARLNVGAIVAGLDADGTPHIYTISDPGDARSQDLTGFGSIGQGPITPTWNLRSAGTRPTPISGTLSVLLIQPSAPRRLPLVSGGIQIWLSSP